MPNRRKTAMERKSQKISIRISAKKKRNLEQLAKLRGVTLTEAVMEVLEEFLESDDWKSREIWKYLTAAGKIIDEHENGSRKGEIQSEE